MLQHFGKYTDNRMNTIDNQQESFFNEEHSHSLHVMQLASASVLPMVLKAAVELGVLNVMEAAGPGAMLSPTHIASQLPHCINSEAPVLLDRMLHLLAVHSILVSSADSDNKEEGGIRERLYGLAPVANYFIQNKEGVSLAPLLCLIQDKAIMDTWYHLKDAVLKRGTPFQRAYNMNAIDYNGKDARFSGLFRDSMKDYNTIFTNKILEIYKGFEGLQSLVDVGGGNGVILNAIISKYPAIKGINFDLAPVIHKSPSYHGIENIAGDMFVSIPKGDSIFMKCVKLLKNCYEAIPDQGKVIVVDLVIPEATSNDKGLFQFDLFAMNLKTYGKERTEREFESLGRASGFTSIRVACSAYCFSVVEFRKF